MRYALENKMNEIVAQEIIKNLSNILERVENGESFSILNNGKIVAIMSPPEDTVSIYPTDAFSKLNDLRKTTPVGTLKEVTEWKNIGRR